MQHKLVVGIDPDSPDLVIEKSRPVKRSVDFQGILCSVEIDVGDVKRGIDPDGIPWKVKYKVPYGEIPNSKTLADGEGVDIYLGPNPIAGTVYVVHQLKPNGKFDEDKCFLGFDRIEDAVSCYFQHGPRFGWGGLDIMSIDSFRAGYLASNRIVGKDAEHFHLVVKA